MTNLIGLTRHGVAGLRHGSPAPAVSLGSNLELFIHLSIRFHRGRVHEKGGGDPPFRLGLINAWIIFTSFHLREFCFLSASLNHSAWKRFLSPTLLQPTLPLSHSLPHPFPCFTSFPSLQSLFCSIIHWRKCPPPVLVYTCRGELSRSTALASTFAMNRFVVIPSTLGAYWVSGNC